MAKADIVKILKSAGVTASEEQIERPSDASHGDFAFPCFHLAKAMRKSPVDIAEGIAKGVTIPKNSVVSKAEAVKGYVNFHLDYVKVSPKILKAAAKRLDLGKGKKVMVEYSQPNPVHPMHIGHARSTFLGDALANILSFVGYDVVRANLMNDVGLQVAKLVYSYMNWADGKKPEGKPDLWLWQYYVKVHDEIKKDPSHEDRVKEILKSYESSSDKTIDEVWNRIVKWCVEGFEQTYKRLGVNFDVYFYEHDYRQAGKKIVESAVSKGLASKTEEGAVLANLEKYGLPNTILLRSNGTGLYITSDLGLTVEKFSKYGIDKSVWVVDARQTLNFKQLFKIFETLGYKWHGDCYHLPYETVGLPEGKMSSREGRAVLLDDVVDRIVGIAKEEINKRNPEAHERESSEGAERIGIGALKYAIVRIEPHNQITFDWKQMLSLEGNTAPYIQYAHTRCASMLKKASKFKPTYTFADVSDDEKHLLRKISEFEEVVSHAAEEMKPHIVCNYAYDLATVFNNFYQKVPVIKTEDDGQRNFRLTIVSSCKKALEACLNMIGVDAPEKM
jgi:arginyl-tRNA synthetase